MDYDHSPNCESRLFGTKCTCDAAQRATADAKTEALLAANDGKMPLASELARQQPPEVVESAVATSFDEAISAAMKKLTDQGLTATEAHAVIARRIAG